MEQAGGGAGAHRVRARYSTQRAREGARQEGRGQGAPTPPTPNRWQGGPLLIPLAHAFVIHCAVAALSFRMRILPSKIPDPAPNPTFIQGKEKLQIKRVRYRT